MLFGKLMLLHNNVLLMDEPTNHLDMESIESLNTALEKYQGHADLRLARPRIRFVAGDAHHRNQARMARSSTTAATTRNTWPARASTKPRSHFRETAPTRLFGGIALQVSKREKPFG